MSLSKQEQKNWVAVVAQFLIMVVAGPIVMLKITRFMSFHPVDVLWIPAAGVLLYFLYGYVDRNDGWKK